MTLLLDTHAFLWFCQDDPALSATAKSLIEDAGNRKLVSVAVIAGAGYELMGFDGAKSVAEAVQLDLLFLGRAFNGRFLLIDQTWGILGRDIGRAGGEPRSHQRGSNSNCSFCAGHVGVSRFTSNGRDGVLPATSSRSGLTVTR